MMFLRSFGVLFFVGTLICACQPKQQSVPYSEVISKHRIETDQLMNESEDSPFAATDSVVRLSYFPIDEKFKVIASVEPMPNGSQMTLGTSDGTPRVFVKHALLKFTLNQKPQELLVLKGVKDNDLFLAFSDLTNDASTYGGGRYLNVNFSDHAQKITLDFNMAYNPYCEYNSSYSCPLPPVENYLKIAIEAGEKNYKN